MRETIDVGTILLEQGTVLPDSVNLEVQSYDLGWSVITNPTRAELGRQLVSAGWSFFYMAGELRQTGFGFDEQSRTRQAVVQLIKNCQRDTFNCLEITRMTRKSWLGISRTQIFAHGRHIQAGSLFHSVPKA